MKTFKEKLVTLLATFAFSVATAIVLQLLAGLFGVIQPIKQESQFVLVLGTSAAFAVPNCLVSLGFNFFKKSFRSMQFLLVIALASGLLSLGWYVGFYPGFPLTMRLGFATALTVTYTFGGLLASYFSIKLPEEFLHLRPRFNYWA